ncbi:hypothetical protein K7432_016095 [Basidiobolus ranarum]|uniref:SH3 domain-containing protein n=1 Tax=Basidiobolus ranarum TaxID=34480 RepID=A0ABR2VN97_9FUNG
MLVLEKIEAANRESHAIERLAKQKIDAACREKEDLEKKFRERMHQVEIAIKKTELEKNEIQNGKQNMCSSHVPPPVPPPPLPISSSPSLVGNQPLWLNHKPPSPTDFPRTSISSIQKVPISSRQRCGKDLQSYPFVSQPPVHHKRHSGRAVMSHHGTSQPRDNQQPLDKLQIGDFMQHGHSTLESVTCSDSASTLSFSVKTLYSYTAPGDEYLGFEKNAYIVVDPAFESEDWWFGKLENSQVKGWFPKTYVSIEKIPGQVPFLARVLYDYKGVRNDELDVKADSVVDILEKTDVNWWKAQYQGNIGMIPARYVQQLMTTAH